MSDRHLYEQQRNLIFVGIQNQVELEILDISLLVFLLFFDKYLLKINELNSLNFCVI